MTIWTIPLVKIEPNGLTITKSIFSDLDLFRHYHTTPAEMFGGPREFYSNFSNQSKTRLRRAFHLLLAISKEKTFLDRNKNRVIKYLLTFTTLTLSAKQGTHSDYAIKKQCLDNYLQNLRHSGGLTHYIWRAEPQKNGNLHFHITANQSWDWQYIRDTWNNAQKRLGYIDLFNEKHHHINPNSTDIHSVRKIEKAGAYISKYISKIDNDSRLVQGKIWDCSQSLKPKQKCTIYCQGNDHDALCLLERQFEDRIYSADHFKFIPLSKTELVNHLPPEWLTLYNNYLHSINTKYFSGNNEKKPISNFSNS